MTTKVIPMTDAWTRAMKTLRDPPDLQHRIEQARAWYEALSPIDKAIHDLEQKH